MPNQVVRSALERGFNFNLMVIGETGIGKTTLVSNLLGESLLWCLALSSLAAHSTLRPAPPLAGQAGEHEKKNGWGRGSVDRSVSDWCLVVQKWRC